MILLRRTKDNTGKNTLTVDELSGDGNNANPMVAGTIGGSFDFESGWEVLMGQNEVKNWMRSTAESTKTMSFPGTVTDVQCL